MSTPTPTTPASPPPAEEFDPLVFWVQHRQKVVAIAGLLVVALGVYFASELIKSRKLNAASRALATAKTDEELRKVVADFAGTAAAGNAQLLLADNLRKAGKLDEATTALQAFIDQNAEHPLVSGAWTSLAATQELQGKPDDALNSYQRVSTSFSTSFSAPVALMGQARIYKQKGRVEDARRTLDQVINQFPNTLFSSLATRENQQLKKSETPGASATTTPTAASAATTPSAPANPSPSTPTPIAQPAPAPSPTPAADAPKAPAADAKAPAAATPATIPAPEAATPAAPATPPSPAPQGQ